jgi:hypothetical protein
LESEAEEQVLQWIQDLLLVDDAEWEALVQYLKRLKRIASVRPLHEKYIVHPQIRHVPKISEYDRDYLYLKLKAEGRLETVVEECEKAEEDYHKYVKSISHLFFEEDSPEEELDDLNQVSTDKVSHSN